jgi:hypothetical protein
LRRRPSQDRLDLLAVREVRRYDVTGADPQATGKWSTAPATSGILAAIADAFREADSHDPQHLREWVILVDGNASTTPTFPTPTPSQRNQLTSKSRANLILLSPLGEADGEVRLAHTSWGNCVSSQRRWEVYLRSRPTLAQPLRPDSGEQRLISRRRMYVLIPMGYWYYY